MDLTKYNHLIRTADDFLEAAERCSFDDSLKVHKWPLTIPHFTNRAFACELYIKATLYLTKNVLPRGHKLDKLFSNLNKEDKKGMYDIWRTIAGENMPDCDYAKKMFYDNLEANSNVFTRFRYVHEWAGKTISLESSFVEEQMHLHGLTIKNFKTPTIPIYDGFLDQLAKSIKKYNIKLGKLKLKE